MIISLIDLTKNQNFNEPKDEYTFDRIISILTEKI